MFRSLAAGKLLELEMRLVPIRARKIGDLLPPSHVGPLDDVGAHEPVMAQLVCKNCAHLVLFDVRRIKGWHDEGISDSSQTMIF